MTQPTYSHRLFGMPRKGRRRRRGAVMVAALFCLLIVMAMIGTMLQGALRARRQLHTERNLRQAELLLQAGADRASFRLASEAGYQGETWAPPREATVGRGQVTIEALRDSDTKPWRVHIVAEYPLGSERSIRRSRTFLFFPSAMPRVQE